MTKNKPKRLILISNRLPFQLTEKNGEVTLLESDGGLVSSLKSYFEHHSMDSPFQEKVWIGAADFPEKRWQKFKAKKAVNTFFKVEPLFIDNKLYQKYYNGFCNATLWPLFHYFPSFTEFDENTFKRYEEVNEIFCEKLLSFLQPGDTLWIHDYHLLLLPGLVREKLPNLAIGFFLHIPFPSYELFRLLHRPWKEKIIQGLLGADLVGFHTHEYVQHFLKTVRMVAGFDPQYRTIPLKERIIKADLFPLGIDFQKFNTAATDPTVQQHKESILTNFSNRKIIFSVDRLDYTKGVTHRLAGFEYFLELFPAWREQVVFILVVVPSRQIISKYNERRKLIEEHVGRINGKYSTLQWQPIIYRYSNLSFHELSALYQVADVAVITPLRDGMNLVAKEYVASRTNQDGVLVLSELAGAANEMGEAVLVNPMDRDEVANAINTALTMPLSEQKQNMAVMQKRLVDYDVVDWVNDFFKHLAEIKELQQSQATRYATSDVITKIKHDFDKAQKRLLFLDYDGTLVPFTKHPRNAAPNTELLYLLFTLSRDDKTEMVIISGREFQVMEEWFRDLPAHLVAEHGASVKLKGLSWQHENEVDQSWKELVRPTLELFTQRSPGSFVEEKNHTLAWHYRTVDPELGFIRSRELLDTLFHLLQNAHLSVLDGKKVIEIRVAGVDKGAAVKKILEQFPSDFVTAIGDDKTDEDMFKALNGKATITMKVGSDLTAAHYNLPSHQDVLNLLRQMADL